MRHVEEVEIGYSRDPCTQLFGQPTNRSIIIIAEVFPKKQEIQSSHQTPQARGSCIRKISPQNILKSSSTCFLESQRAVGKFPPS